MMFLVSIALLWMFLRNVMLGEGSPQLLRKKKRWEAEQDGDPAVWGNEQLRSAAPQRGRRE